MTDYNQSETVTMSIERYELLRSMATEDGKKIELLEKELVQYGKVLFNDFEKGWMIISEADRAEKMKDLAQQIVNTPLTFRANTNNL